jgi:hypothetical protein
MDFRWALGHFFNRVIGSSTLASRLQRSVMASTTSRELEETTIVDSSQSPLQPGSHHARPAAVGILGFNRLARAPGSAPTARPHACRKPSLLAAAVLSFWSARG